MFVLTTVYTAAIILRHGIDFVTPFFGAIREFSWAGQFNLDFLCLLNLTALWIAWRHRFSAAGLALALLPFVAGMPYLCAYLLVEAARGQGDPRSLLLGQRLHDR
jgi:hypothetical protein